MDSNRKFQQAQEEDEQQNAAPVPNYEQPTEGRIVTFVPSERTLGKIDRREDKTTFPAIVVDVNKNSIDITAFGLKGHTLGFARIPHKSEAEPGRSYWEWPVRK